MHAISVIGLVNIYIQSLTLVTSKPTNNAPIDYVTDYFSMSSVEMDLQTKTNMQTNAPSPV